MEDYDVVMNRLLDMRSRFDSGFSSSDRLYIEHLYRLLLNKAIRKTGCSDCYRDAYIEVYNYLKREGNMPTKPNYILKVGAVVHPKGTNKYYAGANIPDEVAENWLAEFPNAIEDFQSFPIDYATRVEARKNGEASTPQDAESLAKALEESESARKDAEQATEKVKAELETAKTELETVKAELEAAKAELETLKQPQEESATTASKKKSAKSAE